MDLILKIAGPVFAVLVILTNMITESLKKVKEGANAKVIALMTAIILSIVTCLAAAVYLQFTLWYYFAATVFVGVILGFIVAQVAETGYDGAYMEFIEILKTIVSAVLGAKSATPNPSAEDTENK